MTISKSNTTNKKKLFGLFDSFELPQVRFSSLSTVSAAFGESFLTTSPQPKVSIADFLRATKTAVWDGALCLYDVPV